MIFNENLGKVAEQYLKKGSKVYVEGQLQTRKWTDKDGAEKYTTEVVLQRYRGELTLMDSRGAGGGDFGGRDEGGGASRAAATPASAAPRRWTSASRAAASLPRRSTTTSRSRGRLRGLRAARDRTGKLPVAAVEPAGQAHRFTSRLS